MRFVKLCPPPSAYGTVCQPQGRSAYRLIYLPCKPYPHSLPGSPGLHGIILDEAHEQA
jgi:hypothetical protein